MYEQEQITSLDFVMDVKEKHKAPFLPKGLSWKKNDKVTLFLMFLFCVLHGALRKVNPELIIRLVIVN